MARNINEVWNHDSRIPIMTECNTNEDCSGASDTCKSNVCYCGSETKCTRIADTCKTGQCKCGEYDECSSHETCILGKCKGKWFSIEFHKS